MTPVSYPGADDFTGSGELRSQEPRFRKGNSLVIGFVNNMPDAALRTTERQFRELLSAASRHVPVRLRYFSIPELPRGEAGRAHISENYEDLDELWESDLDGLIVTGTEPRAPDLRDEPYWPNLAKLIDWAEDHLTSTIWSCLAAHAAAFHLDRISRRALPKKLSGVFDSIKAGDHAIVAGAPPQWCVPHSRYNELPEEALVAKGYQILSRSRDAGADICIKQRKSLFIFLQGHPEYDPGALLREYRRDIGRFLSGERDSYPEMPRGYFDQDSAAVFADFQRHAVRNRNIDLLTSFPAAQAEKKLEHPWGIAATCIYANWLSYLVEKRSRYNGGKGLNESERAASRDLGKSA
jgi:homoserine O-succinyltransferase/O-acetyltransferase